MIIKTFVEGPINANNYLIIDEDSREAVLIDCSSARPEFVQAIKNSDVKLKYIFLTHGHFDHLLGVDKFKSEFGVDTYVSQDDLSQVKLAPDMMLMFAGEKIPDIGEITHFVKDGDEFSIGNTKIKAIRGSVGRCDLPEGDFRAIEKSIKEKLFKLPDETAVYTGHGDKTTIGYEKRFNEIVNV